MIRASLCSALTFLCLGLAALPAQNSRKGGGGSTPPGTIYFHWDDPAAPGDRVVHMVDASGNLLGTLPPQVKGDPSHGLHNGQRWFLSRQNGELYAIDATGANQVHLTSFGGNPIPGGAPQWWGLDDPGTSFDENDSYVVFGLVEPATEAQFVMWAPVTWGVSGPQAGTPSMLLSESDFLGQDLLFFDLAPDGQQIVYGLVPDCSMGGWCATNRCGIRCASGRVCPSRGRTTVIVILLR